MCSFIHGLWPEIKFYFIVIQISLSAGLFYDGIDNGIGTEMALLEANKLNAAFARAIWEEEKERERLEREKEKEAADKYKAEREKGDESSQKDQGDENKGTYVCAWVHVCVRGCMRGCA